MDEWEIDVMITGSQKALMIPPGLAFVAFGPRAWAAAERSSLPKFYFDLRKELKAQLKDQTAWSPATSHLFALEETLRLIQVEGLPRRFHRHAALGAATRAAVLALGLELLSPECPSDAVTAVKVPRTIADGKAIPKGMRAAGVIIAGGQDALEGKIFRLSHFGAVGPDEILTGISTLEQVLVNLGVQINPGSGVGAAKKVLSAAGLI
jgi:aspartate aminotransferase-like enzyme